MPHTGVQLNDQTLAAGEGVTTQILRLKGKNHLEVHLDSDAPMNISVDVRNGTGDEWINVESWNGQTTTDYRVNTAAGEARVRMEAGGGNDVVYTLFIGASG